MAIRPVDYQILMPKVNEAAKIQSDLQQKSVSHAQQQAESSVKQAEKDTKRVHTQSETQKTIITDEERRKGSEQEQSKKKKSKKEDTAEVKTQLPHERHTIDIRI